MPSAVEARCELAVISMLVWNDFCNDARVLKEAQTLARNGFHVTVNAYHVPGKTMPIEVVEDGITVRRVCLSLFKRRKAIKPALSAAPRGRSVFSLLFEILGRCRGHMELLINVIRQRPAIVHAHDVNTLPTAWLAAKLSRARLIYDAHEISTSREGYAGLRRLVAWIEGALMPRAHGTITTTEARAKFFARAYGIDRPVVLQNRPRRQLLQGGSRIRDELRLVEPWPIVLYQGGVQQGRGLERLVRVAALVPNAYFVFIGGGRLDASLRSIAAELMLEDRVYFIPTVALAELPSYTASASIGVQPIENTCLNHYTTDSNKLFEYVQAGLPVVSSDLPEIRLVVRAHELGLLVSPGDTEALAAALRTLVDDQAKRNFHAEQSLKAAAVLNWEEQEGKLIALYKRVLKQKKAG